MLRFQPTSSNSGKTSSSIPAMRALTSPSFFINDVGQIRMIDAPEKPYVFHSTNNERVNEVRREAMQGKSCYIRQAT